MRVFTLNNAQFSSLLSTRQLLGSGRVRFAECTFRVLALQLMRSLAIEWRHYADHSIRARRIEFPYTNNAMRRRRGMTNGRLLISFQLSPIVSMTTKQCSK